MTSPKVKRFFSKVPGSQFIMPDGFAVVFAHGHFDFDPSKYVGTVNIPAMNGQVHVAHGKPKAQIYWEELEGLVNSNNPLVFDQDHLTGVAAVLPPELDPKLNAHSEAEIARAESALSRIPGRITGEVNNPGPGAGAPTDVNASTVDPKLQAQVFKPVGPGAAAAAAAAAKARATQAAQTVAANSQNGVVQ